MKVYIATSGEYSDYGIAHVFAREEDARAGMERGQWRITADGGQIAEGVVRDG